MTALAIREDHDLTMNIKEHQDKNKWSANFDIRKKPSKKREIFDGVCWLIEKCDLFGAKPNLDANCAGSSFVGFCGVVLILALTILTVCMTVSNANVPQIMILENFEPGDNYGFSLTPGSTLKFAVCSNYLNYLKGSNRVALFRFYYENAAGRTYLNPVQLTSTDYSMFDLTKATSPVDISYCFTMQSSQSIFVG
jgi:hypothetical protein